MFIFPHSTKISGPNLVAYLKGLNQPPIFEQWLVKCITKTNHHKSQYKRDLTMSSKFVNHFSLNHDDYDYYYYHLGGGT